MKGAEVQTETRDSQENVGFGFISKEVDRLAKRKKEEGYQQVLIPAWIPWGIAYKSYVAIKPDAFPVANIAPTNRLGAWLTDSSKLLSHW